MIIPNYTYICVFWLSSGGVRGLVGNPAKICHANRGRGDVSPSSSVRTAHASKATILEEENYESYSRSLSPNEEREKVLAEGSEFEPRRRGPLTRLVQHIWTRRFRRQRQRKCRPGTLILLRCGESEFNANQTFSGWLDPDLTPRGIADCKEAGQMLLSEGLEPTRVYTSRLQRSIKSAITILEVIDLLYIPVFKTFRLNQRMYGSLQGLSKSVTAKEFGDEAVAAWRNSLRARPPPLSDSDPQHPIHDRRYSDLPRELLPSTESLLDCQERARAFWEYKIRQDIAAGETVLVVAHRDSLRGLIKVIDGLDQTDYKIPVPNGMPVVYRFDEHLRPAVEENEEALRLTSRTSCVFLDTKSDRLQAGLDQHERWINHRFLEDSERKRRVASLKTSLSRLRMGHEDAIGTGAQQPGSGMRERMVLEERWEDDPCEFEEYDEFSVSYGDDDANPVIPTVLPLPDGDRKAILDEPVVVFIRHGRTPHNNLGLFTGWEDPPLAEDGIEDAKDAGRLLRRHGMSFDVVYTSFLTRAIQTAYHVLDELGCVWLPVVKSYRLSERMYGALTGKSKRKVANEHGEDQLKLWRRGFTVRPPPVSSYSPNYPGNDVRRAKHFTDLPVSWRETVFRSLEAGKFVVHRRFPKTESLKDCMDRSIPFYTERIRRDAIEKGKRVLITSHENAIRGILMHLCNIPEEAMNQLHLPNGLPLVYNVRGKCISLLEDEASNAPTNVHDFGPAAQYLFTPCELPEDFYDPMDSSKAREEKAVAA